MTESGFEAEVGQVVKLLRQPEAGTLSAEVVERTVRECFAERQDARIKDFVGLFVERAARQRLRSMARGGGAVPG